MKVTHGPKKYSFVLVNTLDDFLTLEYCRTFIYSTVFLPLWLTEAVYSDLLLLPGTVTLSHQGELCFLLHRGFLNHSSSGPPPNISLPWETLLRPYVQNYIDLL